MSETVKVVGANASGGLSYGTTSMKKMVNKSQIMRQGDEDQAPESASKKTKHEDM